MKNIKTYPDGSSYAVIKNLTPNITVRINNYTELWQLSQLVDAYNHLKIKPTITIPNLIDAQADRRFDINQSSGLKLVLKFLNQLDADFKIFHPHNEEVVEAMIDNVTIINNSKLVKIVLDDIDYKDVIESKLILMSSDAGGFKPLMKTCDKIGWKGETFSASKARSWDKEDGTKFVQKIDREDFEGKDVLIIDDISVYGGTFKGLSKLLRSKNCGKLYLLVSHMTVKNLGIDPVTNYFDKVFTTNSKFDEYLEVVDEYGCKQQPDNLKIINFNLI